MPLPQIKLALLMQCAAGLHPGSWLHGNATRGAATSIGYYTATAQLAEQGLFDLFFIADPPAARTENMEAGAADGFMVTFNQLPGDLAAFVELVVPELQRRGLYRTSYEPGQLRNRLGLRRPPNQHARPAASGRAEVLP